MDAEHESIQLIRHAMAKHINEVAQELLYWMEALDELDAEIEAPPAPPPAAPQAARPGSS
jgi:hypothetical protein